MASVTWTSNALGDMEAIYLYTARNAPGAADVLIERIFEATKELEQFPEMGRLVAEVLHDHVRELIVGNYLIAYRVTGSEVEVVTVHHGARRPGGRDVG